MTYPNGDLTGDELASKALIALESAERCAEPLWALTGIGYALLAIRDDLDWQRRNRL